MEGDDGTAAMMATTKIRMSLKGGGTEFGGPVRDVGGKSRRGRGGWRGGGENKAKLSAVEGERVG